MIGFLNTVCGMNLMTSPRPVAIPGLGIEETGIDHLGSSAGESFFIDRVLIEHHIQQEPTTATLFLLERVLGQVHAIEAGEIGSHQGLGPLHLIAVDHPELLLNIGSNLSLLVAGMLPQHNEMQFLIHVGEEP